MKTIIMFALLLAIAIANTDPSKAPWAPGEPSYAPSKAPWAAGEPSYTPSKAPWAAGEPSYAPSKAPWAAGEPSYAPSKAPWAAGEPSYAPSPAPTDVTVAPSHAPYTPGTPSTAPSPAPTDVTVAPSHAPYTPGTPSKAPSPAPSYAPSKAPWAAGEPSYAPSPAPSAPTKTPSKMPSKDPTTEPTTEPTVNPTASTATPSMAPYEPGTPSAAPTTSTAKPTLNPLTAQEIGQKATDITDAAKAIFAGSDWTFTADLDGVDIVANDTTVVTTFVASGDVTLKFTIGVTNTTGPVTEDQEMAIQTQVCAKMQAAISASTLTTFVDTKYECDVDVAATTRRRLLASITTDYEVSIAYTENPTTMAPTGAPIVNDGASSKVCAVYGFLIAFVASIYL